MATTVRLKFTGKPEQQVPGYPAREITVSPTKARELVANSGVYAYATKADKRKAEGKKAASKPETATTSAAGGGDGDD